MAKLQNGPVSPTPKQRKNMPCGIPEDGPWAAWWASGSKSRSLRVELGVHCTGASLQLRVLGQNQALIQYVILTQSSVCKLWWWHPHPQKDGFTTRTFDCCLPMCFYKFIYLTIVYKTSTLPNLSCVWTCNWTRVMCFLVFCFSPSMKKRETNG